MTLNDLESPFCLKFCFVPVCLELWILAFEAWLLLNLYWMSSANFKPKRTAAASRGFLATARLSCLLTFACNYIQWTENDVFSLRCVVNITFWRDDAILTENGHLLWGYNATKLLRIFSRQRLSTSRYNYIVKKNEVVREIIQLPIKLSLKISPHLKRVATIPWKNVNVSLQIQLCWRSVPYICLSIISFLYNRMKFNENF